MGDQMRFKDTFDPQDANIKLARWLEQVLQRSVTPAISSSLEEENENILSPLLGGDYHLHFYQQLPDFIMALLKNDSASILYHAPMLYHMAGCQECHRAYLELYDALRFAISPQEGPRSLLGQGTRTLSATPPRMLGHFCQTLISQAEAVLLQARHDHTDADEAARSLLQLAIKLSSHIGQRSIRSHALHDLVRVATLFEGASSPIQGEPGVHSYTPILAGAGGMRKGGKIVRHAETGVPSVGQEQGVIHLRSQALDGYIVQHDQTLELHLQDLSPSLRGQYVFISVLLGSLLEPVRWNGGNPHAIRSVAPVDDSGTLVTPIGQTALRLTVPEEHNFLETLFLRVDVRVAD